MTDCRTTECVPPFLGRHGLSLLFFGGKGGVGKTTCAAAAALSLARQFPDRRYLVISTDPAHSLADSFGGSVLPSNLEMREIDANESLRKFKEAHSAQLRQIASRGTFLDDEDLSQLLDLSLPGLDEIMAFLEISSLVAGAAYSCVIVDTAATGHTLRFLGLPEILARWVSALDAMLAKHRYLASLYRRACAKDAADLFLEELSRLIGGLAALLRDPQRSRFVPVMLAEPLSTSQTRRFVDRLQDWDIPVEEILVNRLYPPSSNGCAVCRCVRGQQRAELRRIAPEFSSNPLWEIPYQRAEVRGAEQLGAFWDDVQRVRNADEPLPVSTFPFPAHVESPQNLPGKRAALCLFAGKGGVGKTTLACATAFRLSQEYPGSRTLLFSTDPAHCLSDCLQMPVGPDGVAVAPGLMAMEIDATAAFEKLKDLYAGEVEEFFHSLTSGMVDVPFEREVVERLIDLSPPGLDELMVLTRVVELIESEEYDFIVVDTAPTGHLIRLLELPELISGWLRVIIGVFVKYRMKFQAPKMHQFLITLSRNLQSLQSLLKDSRKSHVYAVTILAEMALEETRDLIQACSHAGVNVPILFLNMAIPESECPWCRALSAIESGVRTRFRDEFRRIPQSVVYRCGIPRGADRLTELGRVLYAN
jgi:arsenite-transporting ATPase